MTREENVFIGSFISGFCLAVILFLIHKYQWRDTGLRDAPKVIPTDNDYVLTLVVRTDIPMDRSKVATHCSHASVLAFDALLAKDPQAARSWQSFGQTKIIMAVDSIHVINKLDELARELDVISTFMCDVRASIVGPSPVTVLGIGPGPQDVVKQITHDLELLSVVDTYVQSHESPETATYVELHEAPEIAPYVELHEGSEIVPYVELHEAPRIATRTDLHEASKVAPCVELHEAPEITTRVDLHEAPKVVPYVELRESSEITTCADLHEAPKVAPYMELHEASKVVPYVELHEAPEIAPYVELHEAPKVAAYVELHEISPYVELQEAPEIAPYMELQEAPEIAPDVELQEAPEIAPDVELHEAPKIDRYLREIALTFRNKLRQVMTFFS